MRVFIAVEIPERIRSEIESAVKVCHKNVKPVPKSNIHITMEFLGELDQSGLQRVISMLEDVKFEPFSVSLGKAGTFGKSARVAFVHVETGADKLKTLQSYIHNELSKIMKLEEREYTPHSSIARGGPKELEALTAEMNSIWHGSDAFAVDSLVLKESTLGGPHAEHRTIFEKRLGPGSA